MESSSVNLENSNEVSEQTESIDNERSHSNFDIKLDTTEANGHCTVSNNVNSTDIDKDTVNKLRGDAIGETMYSQSFVLKTLMLFSDLKWTDEVEEDLCFLWDMTLEKDVCQFLISMSYPSLVVTALSKYPENNRFVEIIIGILANLFCSECNKSISEEEIIAVINFIDTDDHLILIQIMRFISSIVSIFSELNFVNNNIISKILFILDNSVNRDLLIKSLETVSKITSDFKIKVDYVTGEFVNSALTAYSCLMLEDDNVEVSFEGTEQQLIVKHLIEIVCNVSAYINQHKCQRILNECSPYSNKFINETIKLFEYFTVKENLIPIDDSVKFFIDAVTYICSTLSINYMTDLFLPIFRIFYLLIVYSFNECNICFDLVGYFISVANVENLKSDLKKVDKKTVSTVFSVIREEKFISEYSYKNNFLIMDSFFK